MKQRWLRFPIVQPRLNLDRCGKHCVSDGMAQKTRATIENRLEELLDIMGLWERAENFPFQLSGGEQQRVEGNVYSHQRLEEFMWHFWSKHCSCKT
jgi:ABC-type uncharacterized transport system ATPase subunit